MRRRQSTSTGQTDSLHIAEQAIASAAKRIAIALYTDDEISAEAMAIIARVDDAMERLQRAGELKSVNKSYRAYRIEASARAEKIVTYTEWMRKYRERLVRDAAAALR